MLAMDIPVNRLFPYVAGGVGLAALENKYIGDNLPPELKNINLGIGGTTAAMMASDNPAMQIAGISAIPMKEMALFGMGSMDKFRRSQQELTDTNLATAKLHHQAAELESGTAGSGTRRALMFMIPALLGSGALAYYASQHKKKENPRFSTVGESGVRTGNQKVRIDLPPSALPKEFYSALAGIERSPKQHTRIQAREPADLPKAATVKAAMQDESADYKPPGILSRIGGIAGDVTGISPLARFFKERAAAAGALSAGDYDNAARYQMGSYGNLAGAALGLRFGAYPLAAALLKQPRLASWITRNPGGVRNFINSQAAGKGVNEFRNLKAMVGGVGAKAITGAPSLFSPRQFTEFPTFGKWIYNATFRNQMAPEQIARRQAVNADLAASGAMRPSSSGGGPSRLSMEDVSDRALNLKYRYNPKKFSWSDPTPSNSIFGNLFNNTLTRSDTPSTTAPGRLLDVLRYGGNRAVDTAYRTRQFINRHPYATLTAASMPLSMMGLQKDEDDEQRARESVKPYLPDWAHNKGPYNMPVTGTMSNLLSMFGGGGGSPLAAQLQAPQSDPFASVR